MKEIVDGLWFIEGENKGRYPHAHSIFLEGEENILVDTGAGPVLKDLIPKTKKVFLTHYHRDHVALSHLFTGAKFLMHPVDAPGVESLEGFYHLTGLDHVDIDAFWKIVRQVKFEPIKIDCYLREGDYLEGARLDVKVLHFPGHTAGHCGLLVEKCGLVFATDIDLTTFGPWYGNPASDIKKFRQSIRRLRTIKPDILITGHTAPIYKHLDQKLAEYEAVIDQRDEAILSALKKEPLNLDQLVDKKIIYKRHYGQEVLRHFEKSIVEKHLQDMIECGKIVIMPDSTIEVL